MTMDAVFSAGRDCAPARRKRRVTLMAAANNERSASGARGTLNQSPSSIIRSFLPQDPDISPGHISPDI